MNVDLQTALHHWPGDRTAWFAFADWLEETGDPRAELTRLTLHLTQSGPRAQRPAMEERLRHLLGQGLEPCLPALMNAVEMSLVLLPPGWFFMGSPFSESYHSPDEGPVHEVHLTRPFYLARYPVTQGQFTQVMGYNPSHFFAEGPLPYYRLVDVNTSNYPVDSVEHAEAVEFCARLSALPQEKKLGRRYRLPTEAEWEYACRAGTTTPFWFGDSATSSQANFDGNYPYGGAPQGSYLKRTCPVGTYRPNAFGLHDLHGNVWEWCADWFEEDYYRNSPREDPPGPPRGEGHVLRGGAWIDASWHCRSADRSAYEALHYVGFRVAVSAE
ncbi:MAG: SUMF1/EgtB/PvdO family nonheme iron enzyme [Gemmataceae bacterium]